MNNTLTIAEKQAIKKSFDQLKKKLFGNNDPLELKGRMYMTCQQMANRTATIDLGCARNNEEENSCRAKAEQILSTDAYKTFADKAGVKSISYEIRENSYYRPTMYMRLSY